MNTTRQIRSTVLGLFVGLAMILTGAAWGSAVPAADLTSETYYFAGDDSGWG